MPIAHTTSKCRLAIIVSHPIQYYAPLYQRLAKRPDLAIKVFFTWHAGTAAVHDSGFKTAIAWDIPLTEGYEFETVPNSSSDPGTHHFLGLRNPSLIKRVLAWRPDLVHLTGWAWLSHLQAMRAFCRIKLPVLFRGDSHLLDETTAGLRWRLKRAFLSSIYRWPTGFLVVGQANRAYYRTFGVDERRLFPCPHSIDVDRFAEPHAKLDQDAQRWRKQLGIAKGKCVIVFAGKFEPKKRPLELMRAVLALGNPDVIAIMVGNGELQHQIGELAAGASAHFIVLPFQNQTRMPLVYRLGDLFVLPSACGETWGLAVNEAMASGRPVLVSDRVGCAADLVDDSCGRVFSWDSRGSFERALADMVSARQRLLQMGDAASQRARAFDIPETENALVRVIAQVGH